MTCILGLETKDGRAFVAGDSGSFTDEGAVFVLPSGKVFKLANGVVVGCAGSRRFAEIFRHVFEPPELPQSFGSDPEEFDRFLVREFVRPLRELLKAEGCLSKESSSEGDLIQAGSGAVLAVPRAGVYYLAADFALSRAPRYDGEGITSTGGGHAYALGAMLSTPGEKDPVQRLTLALDVTARLYNCVREPFTVYEAEKR
jgi:ATP-dependent protease HslVU (ClpYQ) peptidase subunit